MKLKACFTFQKDMFSYPAYFWVWLQNYEKPSVILSTEQTKLLSEKSHYESVEQ